MKTYSTPFFLIIILMLGFFMLLNPQASLTAARDGLYLWYSILLPAMLPFFIVADLLISSGLIKFVGMLLEPVMRPLFRLPGCSSLAVVMGFCSGFPMGAVMGKQMYEDGLLNTEEAERLVCFTNNSSPLFIIGAVGAGMLGSPSLGYILAASQYLSNLLLGLLLRFRATATAASQFVISRSMLARSWRLLLSDLATRHPGGLLSEAIKRSLNNMLAIAGFVVIFSVLTRMVIIWGILDWIALILTKAGSLLHLPYSLACGLGVGLFEISMGSKTICLAPDGDLMGKLLALSAIMAFSGFSIIAQVLSIMAGARVRFLFYLAARLVQVAITLPCTWILLAWVNPRLTVPSHAAALHPLFYSFNAWAVSAICLLLALAIVIAMLMISLARTPPA